MLNEYKLMPGERVESDTYDTEYILKRNENNPEPIKIMTLGEEHCSELLRTVPSVMCHR